jgi:uncharacterized protein YciI
MTYFAVLRERGPRWDGAKPMTEQAAWREHADFMNELANEGFVVLGGPLGDGSKILLIVDAATDIEIRQRLDKDPWTPMELLTISSIEPWQILLASDRTESSR